MTTELYLKLYPDTPGHMVDIPGERPSTIDSGFFVADPLLGWPPYEGGYLHWVLIDIRLYPGRIGELWRKNHSMMPFRVYVLDYDDWNVERLFETEAEARQAILLLSTGTVELSDLDALDFHTA